MNSITEKIQDKEKSKVTLLGAGEAVLSMATGMGGMLAGTGAGTYNAFKEGDAFEYTPAFEAIAHDVNEVVQYQPRTAGGEAALNAVDRLWREYISEPTDKHLVEPNLEHGNPLVAAIGKASGEGLPMFLMMKAPGKSTIRNTKTLGNRVIQKLKKKDPAAVEAYVDIKTGKAVSAPDAPLSDKGAAFGGLKEMLVRRERGATPHEGVSALLKPMFYKPVQVLRDWKSPTLNKIADAIYAPTKADAKVGVRPMDLVDLTAKSHGKFMKAWDSIIEPYKGRFNTVGKTHGEAITRGLRTGKSPKQYVQSVKDMREFLDVFVEKYVQKVLPDVGRVENYVPQVWNVPYLQRHPRRFVNFAMKDLKMTRDMAETTLRRIVDAEGSPEFYQTGGRLANPGDYHVWSGRVKQRGAAAQGAFERSRKIEIPEKSLPRAEEFLLNNIGDLIPAYIRNATQRVEYARIFGKNEGRLNAGVAKAIKELGIENNYRAIEALTRDVYGLADALQGKYKPIQSLSLAKWNRRIANYETTLHLGLVALASFPEAVAPAIQFGFVPKAYAKGFAHAILEASGAAQRILRGKRTIPKLKAAEALESMGAISLTPLQSFQAARFSSTSSYFTSRFMNSTGLELLTEAQRVIAYETVSAVLKRNAEALTKKQGKNRGFYRKQLEELGVPPEKAIQWVKEGRPTEGHLANIMENAKMRGQRWAITTPNAATKPLLFSDPHWTNVLLFKSFTGVFSNLFLKRALKEVYDAPTLRKGGVIGGMAAATTIAYYTQFLRDIIKDRDNDRGDLERWADAVDRAGLTGPGTYAYMLANPYRYGFTDSSSRRLFNLLGPAVGDTAKVMDAMIDPSMSRERRANALADMVPITNITGATNQATAEVIEEVLP